MSAAQLSPSAKTPKHGRLDAVTFIPADSINRRRRGWLLYPPPEEEEG